MENSNKLPAALKKKIAAPASKKIKEKPKEEDRITNIEFKFTRVDTMTLICLMAANTDKTMPDMMRFWNCDLDENFVRTLSQALLREGSQQLTSQQL